MTNPAMAWPMVTVRYETIFHNPASTLNMLFTI
jgi:hypothetical protein